MGANQPHVSAVSEALHGLAEDRVVYQLEKVRLEIRGGLLSEFGVQADVRLHPSPLFEFENL